MKATIVSNNEHTNITILKPDKYLRNVEKTSKTLTLLSPFNTSVLEKTTKLLTPHPMTFIHQNKHYHIICIQNWHSSEPTNHCSCKATYEGKSKIIRNCSIAHSCFSFFKIFFARVVYCVT